DNAARVRDEELVIVRRAFRIVEKRRRARDRGFEPGGVDVDVVLLRERLIAFTPEHRARIDEREVDVEHDGARAAHKQNCSMAELQEWQDSISRRFGNYRRLT